MDDIHEYLLLKGVDAVSIHGGKEQEERNEAIKLFKVRIVCFSCVGSAVGVGMVLFLCVLAAEFTPAMGLLLHIPFHFASKMNVRFQQQ